MQYVLQVGSFPFFGIIIQFFTMIKFFKKFSFAKHAKVGVIDSENIASRAEGWSRCLFNILNMYYISHFLSSDDHSSNIYIFEEKETTDKSYVKTASNVPS